MPGTRLSPACGPPLQIAIRGLGAAAALAALLTMAASPAEAAAPGPAPGHGTSVTGQRYRNVLISDQMISRLSAADVRDVPSSFGLDAAGDGIEGRRSAELFASAGSAVAEPDYVGLGSSPGHPEYLAAASEVSASLDLLRAAAQLARERGEDLGRNVLVTGSRSDQDIARSLPASLQGLLTPRSLRWLHHPSGALLRALVQLGAVDHDVSDFVALPRILCWFRHWLRP